MNVWKSAILALVAAMLLSAPAGAQMSSLGPPMATVRIKQIQIAFIGSGALGGGSVTYRGRTYGITVGGLGIGGIGASTLSARGTVYGLRRLQDFAGPYLQLREGWALGDTGRGRLWLRNDKGVTLRLATHREGLQLALGADGVLIGFRR